MLVLLLVLCAVVLALWFLSFPGESSALQRTPFWGVNHAHRGLHSRDKGVPENSLAAFIAAVDAGYGIELDIQLSKDGEVVVFHDDDLERVCGVSGRVDAFSYEELSSFRLLGTDYGIPHLRDVLKVVDGRVPMIIELKTGPRNTQLCQSAWRILRQYDGDICIESFDPRIVRWFYRNVPGLLRGQLAAQPSVLGGDIKAFLIGYGLLHFLSRPHFIAYQKGKRPLLIRVAMQFCMNVVWTLHPEDNVDLLEMQNDAVIFEFYTPAPHYADAPSEPADAPADEDFRF